MSSRALPFQVLLIRHGEKVGDPEDEKDGDAHLSIRGSARAASLPSLFMPPPRAAGEWSCHVSVGLGNSVSCSYAKRGAGGGAGRFLTPDRLIAAKESDHSNRPVETLTPLAQALALDIHHGHADTDYAEVAHAITTKPEKYGGKVVLIAWHHGKLPELAKALGVPANQVDAALFEQAKWPANIFDWIWQITWNELGSATMTRRYQQLLFGDTSE